MKKSVLIFLLFLSGCTKAGVYVCTLSNPPFTTVLKLKYRNAKLVELEEAIILKGLKLNKTEAALIRKNYQIIINDDKTLLQRKMNLSAYSLNELKEENYLTAYGPSAYLNIFKTIANLEADDFSCEEGAY